MSRPPLPTIRDLLARVHLRLILFAVLLAAASLTLSGGIVIRNYAQRNLDLVARTVAYTVEPAVVFGDRGAITEGVESVASNSAVQTVEVRDERGRVLATWSNPRSGMPHWLRDATNRLLWPSPARADVLRAGVRIAEVRITGNPEGLLRFALAGLIIACSTLGLTVIATRILARRLQSDVIGPLEHVADVAHAVRIERTFERRVPLAGIAEIDRFGRDFNALLAELQGWHASVAREHAELAERVLLDPLTGLGNRVAFEQAVANAVDRAVKAGTSLSVLYCDVDRFKAINDTYGHANGDLVLCEVANRLRSTLRQDDRAFRLGGDEFVVLVCSAVSADTVDRVAGRIAQALAEPVELPDTGKLTVRLSIGAAIYPDDGHSPLDLLQWADAAMYHEKRARNGRTGGTNES
jgi:diguanylate cyclase (GGDEF)-like protein